MRFYKLFSLTLLLVIFGCKSKVDNRVNSNNNCDEKKYIDSKFNRVENVSLNNKNVKNILNIISQKKDTSNFIKKDFIKKHICIDNNTCFQSKNKISYFPIGRIDLKKNYCVLIYERYEHKFPRLLEEIKMLMFDINHCKVVDRLVVFKDKNVGIINCDEIGFQVKGENIKITYKSCEPYSARNEKEKGYKYLKIRSEYYSTDLEKESFVKFKESDTLKLYDFHFNRYVKF